MSQKKGKVTHYVAYSDHFIYEVGSDELVQHIHARSRAEAAEEYLQVLIDNGSIDPSYYDRDNVLVWVVPMSSVEEFNAQLINSPQIVVTPKKVSA